MSSYLFASSSSSPVIGQASACSITEARRMLTAAPLTSARLSTRERRGRRSSGKKKKITSKMFNPVAGRPIATIHNGNRQIQVAMSYTTSAWATTSITVQVYKGESFILTNFAKASALQAVFDQYRFDEIEIWIEPVISQSSAIALVSNYATAVDLDDANTPAAFTDVNDHQSAIVSNGEAGHYHKWQPHMAVAVYSGAFTSFGNDEAGWIDIASPSVQHYGLKFATNSATSSAIIYSLTVKAKLSFRSPGL